MKTSRGKEKRMQMKREAKIDKGEEMISMRTSRRRNMRGTGWCGRENE